jgi:mRNA interferase HigB
MYIVTNLLPAASNQKPAALLEWYHEMIESEFKNFNDLKKQYGSDSIGDDNRVVFNILGNKFRLVVRIVFEYKVIQVKWFGTHEEYNQINEVSIKNKKHEIKAYKK